MAVRGNTSKVATKNFTHDIFAGRMSKRSCQYAISNLTCLNCSRKLLQYAKELNAVSLPAPSYAGFFNAQSGTRVLKGTEGFHNKAFILTMDNGAEVFAKLPNPNAGPAQYTTASEVATRQMVCVGARLCINRNL